MDGEKEQEVEIVPGRYRVKECKNESCKRLHKRSGPYCCRSCGNSRSWDAADKLKKSIANKKYYQEGDSEYHRYVVKTNVRKALLATGKLRNENITRPEEMGDEYYIIPDTPPERGTIEGGDLWITDD